MKSVNECTFRRFFRLCPSEELLHLKFLVLELLEFLVLLVLAVMSVMTVGVVAVAVRMSCYYNSFWRHVTMLHHHWLSRRVHPWLHHHFAVTKQLMTANWHPAFKYLTSLGHRESNDRFRRWTTESESSAD